MAREGHESTWEQVKCEIFPAEYQNNYTAISKD